MVLLCWNWTSTFCVSIVLITSTLTLWNPLFCVIGPYTIYVPLIIFHRKATCLIASPKLFGFQLSLTSFVCVFSEVNPWSSICRGILMPMGPQSHMPTCPDSGMAAGGSGRRRELFVHHPTDQACAFINFLDNHQGENIWTLPSCAEQTKR